METIKLGNHKGIPVVGQKHARLRHRLSLDDFQAILSAQYVENSYKILCVLIPAIKQIPEYEYAGFVSQEAWDNDDYDEDNDPGPTTDEIVNAFEKALIVSGAGRVGKILDLARTMVSLTPTQTPPSLASPGSTGEST